MNLKWHVTLISYQTNQVMELTVRDAPDMESAVLAALEKAPNVNYAPVIVQQQYLQ